MSKEILEEKRIAQSFALDETLQYRIREDRIIRVKNQLRRLGIDPNDLIAMIEESNLL